MHHIQMIKGGHTWVSTSGRLPLSHVPVGPVRAEGIGYHDQPDRYPRKEIKYFNERTDVKEAQSEASPGIFRSLYLHIGCQPYTKSYTAPGKDELILDNTLS